uniref:Acid phosphatase 1 n=1 Tax=Ananas comosus var. bracteatus TaxID=296719 RepID=A0A6V7PQF9_ANACO|nr:unnamed protein product [Ananas comosus var. bracteatus]
MLLLEANIVEQISSVGTHPPHVEQPLLAARGSEAAATAAAAAEHGGSGVEPGLRCELLPQLEGGGGDEQRAGWRTVPARCVLYIESYMLGGQYDRDVETAVECIVGYADGLVVGDDGMDAWVLDVDDTCLSNLLYYQGKQFGYGAPFDPTAFKSWARRGICPAIPQVLILYKKLLERGYKVFLLTGRDQETLGATTTSNLILQGFIGHERIFMRNKTYRGQGAVAFKSTIRKQLVAEGYRIRGNVGDQWSDLQGDCVGDRIFKIPNPMYFVP